MKGFLISTFLLVASSLVQGATNGYHLIDCADIAETTKVEISIKGTYPDKFDKTADIKVFTLLNGNKIPSVSASNAQVSKLHFENVKTNQQYIKQLELGLGRSGSLKLNVFHVSGDATLETNFLKIRNTTVTCDYAFKTPRPISGGN